MPFQFQHHSIARLSCIGLAFAVSAATCESEPEPVGKIVINEVACNQQPQEWVEFKNVGDAPMSTTGLSFSNAIDSDTTLPLPERVLAPGALFVMSGRFALGCDDAPVLKNADGVLDEAPVRTGSALLSTWGRIGESFVETFPTPARENVLFVDERDQFFDTSREPAVIDIVADAAAEELLRQGPGNWADVLLRYTSTESQPAIQTPFINAQVRIKGSITLRPWDAKPALKIRFPDVENGTRNTVLGMKRMTLNNLTYDPSIIREYLSYQMMREAGLPAPRVNYAIVRVNGTPRGLYTLIEQYDDRFLPDHFPSTFGMIEGVGDFADGEGSVELDEGDDITPFLRLGERVRAMRDARQSGAVEVLPEVDFRQVARMMAYEDVLGHFDGFKSGCHNYFIHRDNVGLFSILPWSTDLIALPPEQIGGVTPLSSCGSLAIVCDSDPLCRAWFVRERHEAALAAMSRDYSDALEIASRIGAFADPSGEPYTGNEFWSNVTFDIDALAQSVVDTINLRSAAILCADEAVATGSEPTDEGCAAFFNSSNVE